MGTLGRPSWVRTQCRHRRLGQSFVTKAKPICLCGLGSVPYFPRGLDRVDCPTVGYLIDAYPQTPACQMPCACALSFDISSLRQGCVDLYSQARDSLPVYWLPLACDPHVQYDMGLERIYDVGFVGSIGGPYDERGTALACLEKRWKMNDFRRPYYDVDMARVYSQSKIVFNVTLGRILNMRIFEVPPCGALLLTKRSDNGQTELFEEGKHFDTFETLDELESKVEYYLSYPEERERIAHAGQQWALTHHTYSHRALKSSNNRQSSGRIELRARSPLVASHAS